jgi:hypothetical protein
MARLLLALICGLLLYSTSAVSGAWLGWGGWSDRFIPSNVTNVFAIHMGNLNITAISGHGVVRVWDSSYDMWNGPWSIDQVYNFPEAEGFQLTNMISSRVDSYHGLALNVEGAAYSYPLHVNGLYYSKTPVGVINIIAIDTKQGTCAALRADGRLLRWGLKRPEWPDLIPDAVSVVLDRECLVALRGDGTIGLWSSNKVRVPRLFADITSIDARQDLIVGLNRRGDAILWAYRTNQEAQVCASNIMKVAASISGFAAARNDGNVLLWRMGSDPEGSPSMVMPGAGRMAAIQDDRTRVLLASNVIDLADDGLGGVALVGDGRPVFTLNPVGRVIQPGGDTHFQVQVGGQWPCSLRWRRDGVEVRGATNSIFSVRHVLPADAGVYDVVAENRLGRTTSWKAELRVGGTK